MAATPSTAQHTSPARLCALLANGIAAYPTLAARMDKAARLVASGAVYPGATGYAVRSECTSGETYWVTPDGCTCPDFAYRGAYCKHQLAVGLLEASRRVAPPARAPHERHVTPKPAAGPTFVMSMDGAYVLSPEGRAYLDGCRDGQNSAARHDASPAYLRGYRDACIARLFDASAGR